MTLDFESDQFLKLLTDALRAGPGSPQWHEAMLRLQASQEGAAGADEYRILCEARAHLESGKEYRSVRAGPNFTRSVMDAIAAQGKPAPARFSVAKIIALVAAVVVLGTLGMVSYLVWDGGTHSDLQSVAIDSLAAKLLGNATASLPFDQPPSSDWESLGTLPLDFTAGMRPKLGAFKSRDLMPGGLIFQTPMPADTPFEVEAILKVNHSTDDLVPEVAISDVYDFSDLTGTASHELVWLLQWGQGKVVLPSGHVQAQVDLGKGPHAALTVRMRVDQENAIVEMDGKRIWAGPTGLSSSEPRFIAIRLLHRGGEKQDLLSFQSVRILTGQ